MTARTVLDLAAGTGKLTRSLLPLGPRVIAIEPIAEMRAQLARAVPGVEALPGRAEAIPPEDASVDTVLVAQAFHWFDAAGAAAEISRVLRPGGGLGVLRNQWDESVIWVARTQALVHSHAGDAPRHDTTPWAERVAATGLFTAWSERCFPHVVSGDLDALLARVSSTSYISTLHDAERATVLDEVRAIVVASRAIEGGGTLAMPYITHAAWCSARGPRAPRR